MNIIIKIIISIQVFFYLKKLGLFVANKTGFIIIVFYLNISGQLSIIRSQCFENSNIKQKLIILLILLQFRNFFLIRDGSLSNFWTGF